MVINAEANIAVGFTGAFSAFLLVVCYRPKSMGITKLISAVVGALIAFILFAKSFPPEAHITVFDAVLIGFGVPIGTAVAIALQPVINKVLVVRAVKRAWQECEE